MTGLEIVSVMINGANKYEKETGVKNPPVYFSKSNLLVIEKELKALEIIKEKRVDLPYLRCCIEDNQSVERYNEYIRNKTMDYDHEQELTEEEFNILKEVLK